MKAHRCIIKHFLIEKQTTKRAALQLAEKDMSIKFGIIYQSHKIT